VTSQPSERKKFRGCRHLWRDLRRQPSPLVKFILTGVFIGDDPLDVNEGSIGDDVLELDLPDDLDIGEYELIEEGKEATGNGACQHAF